MKGDAVTVLLCVLLLGALALVALLLGGHPAAPCWVGGCR